MYGILGKTLSHSFSPILHKHIGDYNYVCFEKTPEQLPYFIKEGHWKGLNVTNPYKEIVMDYCDEISPEALKIGCVNTLVRRGNRKIYGENTDYLGIVHMLKKGGIHPEGKKILILGNGATSKTMETALNDLGAQKIVKMSRGGKIKFDKLGDYLDSHIVVNCTPVGMYPNNPDALISIENFRDLCGVVDVVYNPRFTKMILEAKSLGIPTGDGLVMLTAQAIRASALFFETEYPPELEDQILTKLRKETGNIILVGMPGAGKTSIGRQLAKNLHMDFFDMDEAIVKHQGRNISEIFKADGEEYFREIEKKIAVEAGKKNHTVIATGGGVVLDPENYTPLKQNGRIYFIDRMVALLSTKGRPLSKGGIGALQEMYAQRKPKYRRFADVCVENTSISETVKKISEDYHETIGTEWT